MNIQLEEWHIRSTTKSRTLAGQFIITGTLEATYWIGDNQFTISTPIGNEPLANMNGLSRKELEEAITYIIETKHAHK